MPGGRGHLSQGLFRALLDGLLVNTERPAVLAVEEHAEHGPKPVSDFVQTKQRLADAFPSSASRVRAELRRAVLVA
jgi:hypothetical protein